MISIAGTAIANLWLGTVNFITHTTGDCIFLHRLYLYLSRNPWPVLFASKFQVFWACQWSLCRRKRKLYSANFGDRLANAGYCIMSNTDHVLKWIVSDEVALYCRWHCTSYNVHDVVCCYENILQFGVLVGYAVVVLHLWRNFHHRVRWPPFFCHFVSILQRRLLKLSFDPFHRLYVSYKTFPATEGRTLEEIEKHFSDKTETLTNWKIAPKSSSIWIQGINSGFRGQL